MPLAFTLMAVVFISFALLARLGIQLNRQVFDLIQSHLQNGARHPSRELIFAVLFYCLYLLVAGFQLFIYERRFIQFGSRLNFEKKIKMRLHQKYARLNLLSYENAQVHRHIYEARVASINIFLVIQTLLSGLAFLVGFIAVGAYFVGLDWRYLLFLALATFPTLLEKIIKTRQETKRREALSMLERKSETLMKTLIHPAFFIENKLLNAHTFIQEKWQKVQSGLLSKKRDIHNQHLRIESLAAVFSLFGQAGGFLLALYFLNLNGSLGQFSATFVAFEILQGFISELADTQGALILFTRMVRPYFDLMDLPEGSDSTNQSLSFKEEVALKSVHFKYPNGESAAIEEIDLSLQKGELVALVGLNGAGKTTLSKVLIGLYPPTQGDLMVDGDTRWEGLTYKQESAVFQDFCRYPATLSENVTISAPTEDRARAAALLEKCGLPADLVDPETHLGRELGRRDLSGGQWQRVAIARGIYRDSEFIVLDEPTQEIDPLQERELYQLFQEVTQGKTAVIVTHRLGSIKFVDRIIVLADGKVVETGTHAELMQRRGLYHHLWKTQASTYL